MTETAAAPLLELDNVDTYYGQIHILQGLTLHIEPGELVCLLGGNASGKSTTLKTILGIVRPRNGTVRVAGEDVTRRPTSYRIARGLAIVPENRRLFAPMTVHENLELGAYLRGGGTTRRITNASTSCSRCCANGAPSWPARSPAASSRWWRWDGP